jgi:hypothetical protein
MIAGIAVITFNLSAQVNYAAYISFQQHSQFVDCVKIGSQKNETAAMVLEFINQVYRLEKEVDGKPPKTVQHEFYQVAFRKKLYHSLEELQVDLDVWMEYYNSERTHQGKMSCGRTPVQTLLDGKKLRTENVGQLDQADKGHHQNGADCQFKSELLL